MKQQNMHQRPVMRFQVARRKAAAPCTIGSSSTIGSGSAIGSNITKWQQHWRWQQHSCNVWNLNFSACKCCRYNDARSIMFSVISGTQVSRDQFISKERAQSPSLPKAR